MSNIGRIKLALAALILVIAWSFDLSIAKAQFDARRCASLIDEATQAMYEHAYKREIALSRQYLTYCVQQSSDYAFGLAGLASALNRDNQHEEALAVANRCLQTNDAAIFLFVRQSTRSLRFRPRSRGKEHSPNGAKGTHGYRE